MGMFKKSMLKQGAIDPQDLSNIFFCDSPREAAAYVRRHTFKQFGLKYENQPKPIPLFGEE